MKKINIVKNFKVSEQSMQIIADAMRNLTLTHSNKDDYAPNDLEELKNVYFNFRQLNRNHYGVLCNIMVAVSRLIRTTANPDWYRELAYAVHKVSASYLTSEDVYQHSVYWTAGMSEYNMLENDIYSNFYAEFTVAFIQTYCPNAHIKAIWRENKYQLVAVDGMYHFLCGGLDGFIAVYHYMNYKSRIRFYNQHKDALIQYFGYKPACDDLRGNSWVDRITVERVNVFGEYKPVYQLKFHPYTYQRPLVRTTFEPSSAVRYFYYVV